MAVKSSGSLSITTDIVGEFGGTVPHSISEYYSGGSLVPAGANPILPSSGAISFSDFYGTTSAIVVNIVNNSYTDGDGSTVNLDMNVELNLATVADGFSTQSSGKHLAPFQFEIDSDTVFNNSISMGAQFADLKIINSGIIAGRGGDGANSPTTFQIGQSNTALGEEGNHAIKLDHDADLVTIENTSVGQIAGGGGGGRTKIVQSSKSGLFVRVGPGGGGGWNGGNGGNAFIHIFGNHGRGPTTVPGGVGTVVTSRTSATLGGNGSVQSHTVGSPSSTPTVTAGQGGYYGGGHGDMQRVLDGGSDVFGVATSAGGGGGGGPWSSNNGNGADGSGGEASGFFIGRGDHPFSGGSFTFSSANGNSVKKTGTITTLTYVGSTTQYYVTRDT